MGVEKVIVGQDFYQIPLALEGGEDLFSGMSISHGTGQKVLKAVADTGEFFQLSKCPECDEDTFDGTSCISCDYSLNPDFDLPERFYQNQKKTNHHKISFEYKSMMVYAYEKNHLGQITKIFFRDKRETFCVFISSYIIRPETIPSRFGDEPDIIYKISIPAGNIKYQKANLKKSLGKICTDFSKPVHDIVSYFLQDYHQKLQNS